MPDAPLPPLPPAGEPRWRTWLDDLRRRLPVSLWPLVAVPAVVVLVGWVVWSRPSSPVTGSLPLAVPAPAVLGEPAAPTTRPGREEREEVVVDVAGAVARPGLARLPPGARVAEAVAAAGGPTADADVSSLNQARVVADGEQVRVPRAGEPALVLPAPNGPARPAGAGSSAPVDLNRATPAELEALPGVGPATATAIITWRTENGGFRRVDDLLEVPGIGPARLERLRPLVRV